MSYLVTFANLSRFAGGDITDSGYNVVMSEYCKFLHANLSDFQIDKDNPRILSPTIVIWLENFSLGFLRNHYKGD